MQAASRASRVLVQADAVNVRSLCRNFCCNRSGLLLARRGPEPIWWHVRSWRKLTLHRGLMRRGMLLPLSRLESSPHASDSAILSVRARIARLSFPMPLQFAAVLQKAGLRLAI
jgi:hypothetical protein